MLVILQALALILWANAAPLLARLLLGRCWAWPIDGGRRLRDGRPLLGGAKTWRGLILALLTTPPVALLLGLPWSIGLLVAAGAMLGDLLASFFKRRLGLAASDAAPLLDQVPESLIPALLLHGTIGLSWTRIAALVAGFTLINLVLTPLATWLHAASKRRHARQGRGRDR